MLISRMDDIMDYVETVAEQCVLYNINHMTSDAESWLRSWSIHGAYRGCCPGRET